MIAPAVDRRGDDPDPLLAEVVPLARLRVKRFPTVSECSMAETAPRLPCSRTS
jgi:hypothetical protein